MSADRWIVLKFGGTSVSKLEYWKNIKSISEKHLADGKTKVVVVCSALSSISNKLTNLIDLAVKGAHEPVLDEIRKKHMSFSQSMGIENPLKLLHSELEELDNLALGLSLLKVYNAHSAARIMALGELMLTRLAAAWLEEQQLSTTFLDIRKYLVADVHDGCDNDKKNYLSAVCESGLDPEFAQAVASKGGSFFLTQGFIASNKRGESVLLGRGGSDLSAALIASKLGAVKIEIWSDVPGLFTSNPRQISSARLIKKLDYTEAQELAFCGAKVLHPGCLNPLRAMKIPLELKWIEKPDCRGTFISSAAEKSNLRVKAVVAKAGVYMISMDSLNMWQQFGFLADAFACFKRYGLSIDLVATSQSNVTVTLDDLAESLDETLLENLLEDLSKFCSPKKIGPCARVSLVGNKIKSFFPELGTVLEAFTDKKCYLITQSSTELNFSFLVAQKMQTEL